MVPDIGFSFRCPKSFPRASGDGPVGTGWMLASTSGTLAPYHPFTSMPGLTAVITTPVHLLTSSGTLQ